MYLQIPNFSSTDTRNNGSSFSVRAFFEPKAIELVSSKTFGWETGNEEEDKGRRLLISFNEVYKYLQCQKMKQHHLHLEEKRKWL